MSAAQVPGTFARDGDLAEEQYRLGTFTDFPSCCPVSAATLAQAGFFYTGTGDKVECFSCHATVEGWQFGDSAIGQHRKTSPWCKFANGFYFHNQMQTANLLPLQNSNPGRVENYSEDAMLPRTVENPANIEADYLLRTRQVVDMSDTLYPRNHSMISEEARLMTFQNWPAYSPITPRELTSAGLYYTGMEDQVACFCCGGILKNWEPGDQAWTEHKRHFPKCLFVLGRTLGNVANRSNSVEFGSSFPNAPGFPKCPDMVQYEARLKTFETWIHTVNKEQLAKAGFYRLGNEDDATRCFYCGGGLNSWQPNDDPWEQHAKWFPGCNYLVEQRGQEFINSVQLNNPPSNGTVKGVEERPSLNTDDTILQNPLMKEALQMGFDVAEIKKIMAKKLQTTGENFKSVEILVADLVEAQSSRVRNRTSENTPMTGEPDIHHHCI
ncbi:E3 ubiquitin-protein ligase XIAP isoform X2 [Rhinatrema bivittatum]|uniref:E3 ubiquitin-protein ligase XIAP isoform X2 n=1 Tax=Rhinatrema bivittatum TaxID=194408 RepID=UPI001128355F|nr:E3 ubiquitin-protein ligase XIAP isoform X2 [Rhinatrema bivittatum]